MIAEAPRALPPWYMHKKGAKFSIGLLEAEESMEGQE